MGRDLNRDAARSDGGAAATTPPMPPSELEAVLDDIGWSGRYLAKRLKCSRNLPWAWLKGRASVPPLVAVWLRGLAHQHRTRPAPDWRTLSLAS